MVINKLTDKQIENYEQILLEVVPKDGKAIGNGYLLRQLKWDESLYWAIRNGLIDRGVLEKGGGQGGSVRLIKENYSTTPELEKIEQEVEQAEIALEKDLYIHASNVIKMSWAPLNRFKDGFYCVDITANQGGKRTGGKWTRPDIVVTGINSYLFIPNKYLDVVTFEIKHYKGLNIDAVYEALAHLRSVTRSYVLLFVPKNVRDETKQTIVGRICDEAQRYGVGVIVADEIDKWETWDVQIEAVRQEPDPEKLNDFIATQVGEENKERIRQWRS